jgi:peptidyl-prolyl cis-trans isomerase A (cyclophilin A)
MDPSSASGGYSALEHAAPSLAMTNALLAAGADVQAAGGVSTPLVEAAARGPIEVVDALLQQGADVDASDATGNTPLMAASERGEIAIVDLLLQQRADANKRSKLGSTALALAQTAGYKTVVERLLQAGALRSAGPDLTALMRPDQLVEKAPANYRARFEASCGVFVVEVERKWAPHAADRFYNLLKHGFFDEQRFFRVVPGHLIQFGLHGQAEIAARWYAANLPDEAAQLANLRGTLAFATGEGPNSRTTQIFVNLRDNADFDRLGFVPFARVIEGLSALDSAHDGYGEVPEQRRILREGNAYLARNFPKLAYLIAARLLIE